MNLVWLQPRCPRCGAPLQDAVWWDPILNRYFDEEDL